MPSDSNEKKFISKRWHSCPIEEHYFGEDRKESKKQRKLATSQDRSKIKQGIQKKEEPISAEKAAQFLRGRVLSITPQGIIVDNEGETIVCALRGILKKEKSHFKNLVTVGDFVLFEKASPEEGMIFHVEPRLSVLSRADNLSQRKEQLIASNIDQVIITTCVVNPQMKPFLVDRYIIAAKKGGMQPVIVVNKIDLLEDPTVDETLRLQERELYTEFLEAFSAVNIPVIPVSAQSGHGLDALRNIMKDKASVFSGQSGVGKSALIQAITGRDIRTGKIVGKTGKGSHTTTTANLIPLEFGGWCIDTPGIKSFGVWNLKKEEIEQYFSEIHTFGRTCKYPNCVHINETECAVIDAVKNGEIGLLRYKSYLYLLDSVSQEHMRR